MSDNWWGDSLTYAARTDVGMRRSNNQDSYCVLPAASARLWRNRGHLFVVADGMGAHAAGEFASRLATATVSQAYLKRTNQNPSDALRDSILEAHATIKRKGNSDPAFHGMGTTCDALVLLPYRALIGHVGDSRVYRLRNRVIEQMTFDHSLVWEIKYNQAPDSRRQEEHIPKNVITRSLGPTDELTVALEGPFETRPGDAFLLCSDGLTGQIADSEIGQVLEIMQPEEATEFLVNLANLRGGPDNITVVVARIKTEPDPNALDSKKEEFYDKRPSLSGLALTFVTLAAVAWVATLASFFIDGILVKILSFISACVFTGLFVSFGRKTLFRLNMNGPEFEMSRLGKGPYTRASAVATPEFNDKIALTCDDLCEVLKKDSFITPDWEGIARAREQAKEAVEMKKYADAIRANISVVNYLMRELRKFAQQKKKKTGK